MVLTPVRATLLSTVVAVFLVAGCQTSGHEAGPPPPDPRPLDAVLDFSAEDDAALWKAEEAEVRACMRERGHVYTVVEKPDHRREAAASPFALLRPDWARSDGYGLTVEQLAGRPPDPNADRLAGLPAKEEERWRLALLGKEDNHREIELSEGLVISYDPDSCVSRAQAELYGEDWPDLYYTVEQLSNEIILATQTSAAFTRAEDAWARCMQGYGLSYRALDDPRQEIREALEDESSVQSSGERELELAGLDLDCQLETGLHEKVQTAQSEASRELVKRSRAELKQYEQAKQAALNRVGRG
ncbi:hypothetical protein PJ985_06770 [Streptomyces sp. ACA25]|uniref:hypothetical protein n=1 Tax=Streptomyces sp. ACA25 TaxID=3022596 RepID=UPI002306F445|nr:hypothetical protein [Streptomyces sp. ACA25]MDB1087269.1 hypothetical protein [Streptomyces sp. ACA25]